MIFPDAFPTLATERLLLRTLEERDLEGLLSFFTDPVAMRYWSTPPLTDLAQVRAILDRNRAGFAQRTALSWAIAHRDDDSLVGTCTLFRLDEQNRRAEVGYALIRARWGQGLMHEALTAVLDLAFGPMRLHRVEADIDPRNTASIRALERLGFAREGLLRERWQVGGEITDSLIMGLLRGEWRARRREA